MRNLSYTLILCWAALGLLSAFGQSGGEAGDIYLKGYNLNNEAMRLEQAGDVRGAQDKYKQAYQLITTVAKNFPDWQPDVVVYRLKALEQKLSQAGAIPVAPTYVPAPSYNPAPLVPQPGYQAIPLPNATLQATPGAPTVAGGMANPLDMINQQFQALQQQNDQLKGQLKLYADGYRNSLQEREQATKDRDLYAKQNQELLAKMAALEKKASEGDPAAKAELEKIKNEAQMVSSLLDNSNKQLADANKAIESLQKEKDALLSNQTKLEGELTEAKKNAMNPEDLKKLLADNTRLKQELEVARKQVETIKTEGGKKDEEITTLKGQLASIQTELTKLRQENTTYQGQVADLTVKLKELNQQMEQVSADKGLVSAESEKIKTENKMLHTIIMRQIRQQERQRQAKELVIAEMNKMENASRTLMDNLEEMTSSKVMLTIEEESLFTEPELKEIFASAAVSGTLEAKSSKNSGKRASPIGREDSLSLPSGGPEIYSANPEQKLMTQAFKAIENNDYKTAEQAYQDALRANPRNTAALANLAGIKLQNKQHSEAELLLQKCLVYEPENQPAHYRLGICYFQQNKLNEALSSFDKCVSMNNNDALAHHYLGIIASRMGNRSKAEAEFKSAVAADPDYGDAYFNLAVLYATTEPKNITLAKKHYLSSLEHGMKEDSAMEKILNGTSAAAVQVGDANANTALAP
ncbi:hypothetical protein BH11VER1_BH11VER1_32440 [soil metagenome]